MLIPSIARAALALAAGFLIGSFRAGQIVQDQKIATGYIGRETLISATVLDVQVGKDKQARLQLGDPSFNNSTKRLSCQAYATLTGEAVDIARSDRITLRAKIKPGFSGYVVSAYRPVILAVDKPDPPDYFAQIRSFLTYRLRKLIDNSAAADLALGFLIGERSLPPDLKDQLKTVGLSHVVVASGFSLSILAGAAKKWAGKISFFAGFMFSVLLMATFILVTGLSPSLLRAGLISGMSLLAGYFGRRFHPARLLVYMAAISAIVKPAIISDLAWQLSSASYAGIMFLSPLFLKFFYGRSRPSASAEMVAVTISAQLFCLPISIYYFGHFSVIGLVGNILVTPAIPAVMLLSSLSIALPAPLVAIAVLADKVILSYQLWVIHGLSNIPWASASAPSDQPASLLLYLPILAVVIVLWRRTGHSFRPVPTLDKSQEYGKIYTC